MYELIPLNVDLTYNDIALDQSIDQWCKVPLENSLVPHHKGFWVKARNYGVVAVGYKCRAVFVDQSGKQRVCYGTINISTGVYKYDDRGERNAIKAPVLKALYELGGTATIPEIAELSEIDVSKVTNSLKNSSTARHPYVERSSQRLPQAVSYAYEYTLTPRGRLWINWAIKKGLIVVL